MTTKETIAYIKQHFPSTPTKTVAEAVNLTINQVRLLAKKHQVVKCPSYKEKLKQRLVDDRRNWFENSIGAFEPSPIQEQLLFGSLLGDGYISTGAARSVNYYYQEHFGDNQREYREWKLSKLVDLPFSINGNYLRSASHPYFKQLHTELYPDGRKTLTKSFLARCTHPVFLAALFLDDGSLTISYRYNERSKTVYCMPSVMLYTLNFNRKENELLAEHLNKTFGTSFVLSGHPDGHQCLLKLNKEQEIRHLLQVINPIVEGIHSMRYKTNLETAVLLKTEQIHERFCKGVSIIISSSERFKNYSEEEIAQIISLKKGNITDQMIADQLRRSYWSVVYKIRQLRKEKFR